MEIKVDTRILTQGIDPTEEVFLLPLGRKPTSSLSIAQQALESRDAYEFAVMHAAYKGMPSPMVKVFHFEDGSYLSFNITYTVADAGRSLPWQSQSTT